MRFVIPTILTGLMGAAALSAQTAPSVNTLIQESRQGYEQIKGNLTKMAEAMPADSYGFRPVAEIRTFGELMAHMADSQTGMCSGAFGERKRGDAASKKTKDEIVAALKASFDECDAAWTKVTAENALESAGRRSRLGTLIYNTTHANEEYGYGAVYLRLKGVVPPSTAGAGMGRGGR